MTTFEEGENYVPPLPIIADRQRSLARSVGDLLKWRNGRDGIDAWRAVTDQRLDDLITDVRTVKRMLWGLIFTCLTGFLTVALAVYFSTKGVRP